MPRQTRTGNLEILKSKKEKSKEIQTQPQNGTNLPVLSRADLGYLVFFSDAFVACVWWYQSNKIRNQGEQMKKPRHAGNQRTRITKSKKKNINQKGILREMDILGLTRWPDGGRVSRSRIRSARAATVKRGARIMFRRHVSRGRTKGEFGIKASGPAVAAAALVAVRAP